MSQDLFFSGGSDSASIDDAFSQTPVSSSGVSGGSGVSSPAAPPPGRQRKQLQQQSAVPAIYCCDVPRCKKTYKTKAGYAKHVIAHKISDTSARMPTPDQLSLVINEMMAKVIDDMLAEPNLGKDNGMKTSCLKFLQSKCEDIVWSDFVTAISDPIISCLSKRSKLFPQNKYQEAQNLLISYLSDTYKMSLLSLKLKTVCKDSMALSDILAERMVFRMSFLLLDNVQIFIAKEMHGLVDTSASPSSATMSDEERKEFRNVLGSFLRAFFKKGYKKQSSSKMWQSLCSCLKENFVNETVSSKQFLNSALWYSSDSEDSITMNEKVFDFFLFVEEIIKPSTGQQVISKTDDVMSKIFSEEAIMGIWFSLAGNYFGEENCGYVMKLMVSAFCHLSRTLEGALFNRTHNIKDKVALRTNLKRN